MAITKPIVTDVWGQSNTTSPDMAVPTSIDTGFQAPGGIPEKPKRGFVNWLFNFCMNAVRYYCVSGVVDWDSAETSYVSGAMVRAPGVKNIYVLTGTPTTGLSPLIDTANWQLWLASPIGTLVFGKIIWAWLSAKLLARTVITQPGFIEGKVLSWQEDWQNVAFATGVTAVGNGAWGGRWYYSISGDAVGGHVEQAPPPWNPPGAGSADADVRANSVSLISNSGGSATNIEEVESSAQIIIDADTCIAIQWDAKANMSGSGNHEDSMGLITEPLLGLTGSTVTLAPVGFAFVCDDTGANWKVYYNTFSGSPATAGTGIAVTGRQRFRIEYYGANAAGDGVERVIFYINNTIVLNQPLSLFSGAPGPLAGRVFFRHYDLSTVSWLNVQTVDLRANTWAGNVVY